MVEMLDMKGKIMKFVTDKCIKLDNGQLFGNFRPFDDSLKVYDYVTFKYKPTEGKGAYTGRSFNNIVDGSLEVISQAPKDITSNYSPQSNDAQAVVSRDALIVRQSCLKAAVESKLNSMGDAPMTKEQLLKLAEEFEKWVFR